ncbi:hypothetical protein F3N42_00455 [Marinihelvus fidelis]|uniref:Uncharacterized protein n=1 Tax=Marinihelvus fidelis TaxID=2613842 RepID=A0A5N0TJH7_9GAMM|nr:hypothetical protein [Marinihelvus fidelis]KAA9134056.1 hypothetical protein F3N42_00455 [Marinihelvus fidelis]
MKLLGKFGWNPLQKAAFVTTLFVLALPGTAFGESNEEFRNTLLRFHDYGSVIRPGIADYRSVLENADDTTLEALRSVMGDLDSLSLSLDYLERSLDPNIYARGPDIRLKDSPQISTQNIIRGDPSPWNPAVPPYPASPGGAGNYTAFTATLEGLGALTDSDGDGKLNDERCSADYEAGLEIGIAATGTIDSLNVACAALPPIADKVCYVAAAVVAATVSGLEIAMAQCSLQDALVDSAEIEAAFENTVVIYDQLIDTDAELNMDHDELFSDISDLSDDHADLLNGQTALGNQIAAHDTNLADHDSDMKSIVSIHDLDIKTTVANHDADIKSAVALHDGDVKALLATLQAVVDANQALLETSLARQLETIRLLNTPQGQRSTDVPACDGEGCDWPNRGNGN